MSSARRDAGSSGSESERHDDVIKAKSAVTVMMRVFRFIVCKFTKKKDYHQRHGGKIELKKQKKQKKLSAMFVNVIIFFIFVK